MTLSSTTSSQTNMLLRLLITGGSVWVSLGVWKKLPDYLHLKVEICLNLQKDRAQPVYLTKEINKRKNYLVNWKGFHCQLSSELTAQNKKIIPKYYKYYCNSKVILNTVKMDTKLGKLSKNSKNPYSKVDVALFNTTK